MAIPISPYPPEVDAHLWRGYRTIHGQIKLGVVLDRSDRAPLWIARVLNLLIAEPAIKLDVVYTLSRSVLVRSANRDSALAEVPITVRPACCVIEISREPDGTLDRQSRGAMAARSLDVLLWLSDSHAAGDTSGLARLGVWAFCLGDPATELSNPPYVHEVLTRAATACIALVAHGRYFGTVRVVGSYTERIEHGARAVEVQNRLTTMAGPLLVRSLLDALNGRLARIASAPALSLRFAAIQPRDEFRLWARGRYAQFATRPTTAKQRTTGLSLRRQNHSTFALIPLESEATGPCLFENDGRHFLFFARGAHGSTPACIAGVEVLGPDRFGIPFSVLEGRGLSYPVVFENRGDIFLLVANSAARSVSLHRARQFPEIWDHCSNAIEGIPIRSAIPLLVSETWFLFVGTAEMGSETFLLYSDRLDSGWHYHDANPVSSNGGCAYAAGPVFVRNGKLYRPARTDAAAPEATRVVLNEIKQLSTMEFVERPVHLEGLSDRSGICAVTIDSEYEVIETAQ